MGKARRLVIAILPLALATAPCLSAQEVGASPFSVDISMAGLDPITWATDSPTLTHLGLTITGGLEYITPFRVPFRLELGYVGVTASSIASDGELYRGWDGFRCAFLTGYTFAPIALPRVGDLVVSTLAGGAVTAAAYKQLPLAYAYPSLIVEPRALLALDGIRDEDSGPFLSLPIELQFRSGAYTLAPGITLGFLYRIPGRAL